MDFKYIDVHAHLNFDSFDSDRDDVIKRAQDAEVAVINVGTHKESSKQAVELAEANEGMWAIVGLHPTDSDEEFDYDFYNKLCDSEKVVGIGECGLDNYRSEKLKVESWKKQIENFEKQIQLAAEVNKPLMLHVRNAYKEALEILTRNSKLSTLNFPGNSHFFAGTIDEARGFLDLGYTLSFTGVITFAKQYEELVQFVPLDRILSETDCPFVAPAPFRGKRNEPAYVVEVVKKIAEIKKLPLEEVREQILKNSKNLFKL